MQALARFVGVPPNLVQQIFAILRMSEDSGRITRRLSIMRLRFLSSRIRASQFTPRGTPSGFLRLHPSAPEKISVVFGR